MAAEVGATWTEPLETEANNLAVDEAPPADLLQELGFEAQTTTKPDETVEEVVSDATTEVTQQLQSETSETEETQEEAQETAQEEEVVPAGKRAQKRIRDLVAQRKELEGALQKQATDFQREMQKMHYTQAQQANAQMEAMRQQNEMLSKQLSMLTARATREEDENLSPVEKFKREVRQEAIEQAKRELAPQLQQVQQQLEREAQDKKAYQAKLQQRKEVENFRTRTQQATRETLFKDLPEEEIKPIAPVLDDMILSYIAATGEDPKVAAANFRKGLDQWHMAKMKAVSKNSGNKIKGTQGIPTPVATGKTPMATNNKPDWKTLRSNGFSNYVEWMSKGSPTLQSRK